MKIKLVKSTIGSTKRIRAVVKALGFRRLQQVIEVKETAPIKGMIRKISHLIEIV